MMPDIDLRDGFFNLLLTPMIDCYILHSEVISDSFTAFMLLFFIYKDVNIRLNCLDFTLLKRILWYLNYHNSNEYLLHMLL